MIESACISSIDFFLLSITAINAGLFGLANKKAHSESS